MKTHPLGTSALSASRLAYGCWRIADKSTSATAGAPGRAALLAAVETGYTLFDHADIYADGEAEKLFGQVLKEIAGLRERILIVTKCGIRKPGEPKPQSPYRYDFSHEYIMQACEGSLRRLGLETKTEGNGRTVEQYPPAGAQVRPGTTVELRLSTK